MRLVKGAGKSSCAITDKKQKSNILEIVYIRASQSSALLISVSARHIYNCESPSRRYKHVPAGKK